MDLPLAGADQTSARGLTPGPADETAGLRNIFLAGSATSKKSDGDLSVASGRPTEDPAPLNKVIDSKSEEPSSKAWPRSVTAVGTNLVANSSHAGKFELPNLPDAGLANLDGGDRFNAVDANLSGAVQGSISSPVTIPSSTADITAVPAFLGFEQPGAVEANPSVPPNDVRGEQASSSIPGADADKTSNATTLSRVDADLKATGSSSLAGTGVPSEVNFGGISASIRQPKPGARRQPQPEGASTAFATPHLDHGGPDLDPSDSGPTEPVHLTSDGDAQVAATSQSTPGALHPGRTLDKIAHTGLRVGWVTGEFGNIELQTVVSRDHVTATIETDHAGLRDALAAEVPNLEQAMAQHQMTLDHLTLDSQTASGRDQQQPQSPLADWRRDAEAVANHPSPELDPVHELQWYSSSTLNVHA